MLTRRHLFKFAATIGLGVLTPRLKPPALDLAQASPAADDLCGSVPMVGANNAGATLGALPSGLRDLLAVERWEQVCDLVDCRELIAQYGLPLGTLKQTSSRSDTRTTACVVCRKESCATEVLRGLFRTGCGASGGAVDLFARLENLTCGGAVRRLEQMLNEGSLANRQVVYAAHWAIMEEAARYYQRSLQARPACHEVRRRLQAQHISQSSLERFQLGYSAPREKYGLITHLQGAGYSIRDMERAGLARRISATDRYADQLMGQGLLIPVRDQQGRIWQLSAWDRVAPMGIAAWREGIFNTYGVRRMVFPSPTWPEDFQRYEQLLVTMRPLDVVVLHQAGVSNVVCPVEHDVEGIHGNTWWRTASAMAREIVLIVQPGVDMRSLHAELSALLVHGKAIRIVALQAELEQVLGREGEEGVQAVIENAVTLDDVYLS